MADDLLGGDDTNFAGEPDPAADFLARERDELGELGEEFGGESGNGVNGSGFEEQQQQEPQEPIVNGFADEVPAASQPMIAPQPIIHETEPESVRKWREEKAALLTKMDEEEKEQIEEWREKAKKDLNDWYERRNEQLGKTKASNRADEEAYVSERDDNTGGTHDWDRVCRMCDFNPKGTKNTKDVTRMRSIFLQLKQNPLVR